MAGSALAFEPPVTAGSTAERTDRMLTSLLTDSRDNATWQIVGINDANTVNEQEETGNTESGSQAVGARVISNLQEAMNVNTQLFVEREYKLPERGVPTSVSELVASLCHYFNNPAVNPVDRAEAICNLRGLSYDSLKIRIISNSSPHEKWAPDTGRTFNLEAELASALKSGHARIVNSRSTGVLNVFLKLELPCYEKVNVPIFVF
jgi:hypothetical protein